MFDCLSYHQEPGSEKKCDNLWLRLTHLSGLSLATVQVLDGEQLTSQTCDNQRYNG
jgi:hypothetical protein